MLTIKNKLKAIVGFAIVGLFLLASCNKEFDQIEEIPAPAAPQGPSINEIINTDTSFSFFKAVLAKTTLGGMFGSTDLRFTAFIPDNNAFRLSGIPSVAVVNAAFNASTATSLVQYHITPQVLPAEQIPTTFPNIQVPSLLNPAPTVSAFLRLSLFPSKRANGAWVNNTPLTATNLVASNGLIHKTLTLVAPPTRVLLDTVSRDTTLTFLVAALTRADSGRTSIADTSLIQIAQNVGANLTVFAPTNDAFRAFLTALGLPPSPSSFGFLPVRTVRGIIGYHVLPTRAFSVNMPAPSATIPTFLNTSIAAHPGVTITTTFTGPFANFTVKGLGNASVSNVVLKDVHAVNGVVHKIDQVLRPQ